MAIDPLSNPYAPPATATEAPPGVGVRSGSGSYRDERRSVPLLVLLTIITLGIYPSVWFFRRRRFLDARDARQKLGPLAFAPLVATVVSCGLAFVDLPPEVDR